MNYKKPDTAYNIQVCNSNITRSLDFLLQNTPGGGGGCVLPILYRKNIYTYPRVGCTNIYLFPNAHAQRVPFFPPYTGLLSGFYAIPLIFIHDGCNKTPRFSSHLLCPKTTLANDTATPRKLLLLLRGLSLVLLLPAWTNSSDNTQAN